MKENYTSQEKIWRSEFGENYNSRNTYSNAELDEVYKLTMGISRTDMNKKFLDSLDKNIRILEVGCNIGMMLVSLQEMGFRNLTGLEIQPKAIQLGRERTKQINFVEGSAYNLPFNDAEFDLVFTTHALIHMSPERLDRALSEIVRCSTKYIFGNEYYAEEETEITNYHGHNNIVWKRDFVRIYQKKFPDLKLIKEENYKYTANNNVDSAFLFEK